MLWGSNWRLAIELAGIEEGRTQTHTATLTAQGKKQYGEEQRVRGELIG